MKKKRDNVISINNKYTINEKKRKKRDQKIKKFAKFRTLIIFACCMIALVYVFSKKNEQEQIYDEKVASNEQLKEELASLQEEEAELKQNIESLSDPEYLAKIAREEYFLSGEGETVFIVPEENASDTTDDAEETTTSETQDAADGSETEGSENATEGSTGGEVQPSESP